MTGSCWGVCVWCLGRASVKYCLLQSEWFLLQLRFSWVVHAVEQFLFIVFEFQEYYKEKCRTHTATPGEQFVFIVLEFQQYYNETVQCTPNS